MVNKNSSQCLKNKIKGNSVSKCKCCTNMKLELSVNKEHTVILIGDNHARQFAEKLASNLGYSYELTGM